MSFANFLKLAKLAVVAWVCPWDDAANYFAYHFTEHVCIGTIHNILRSDEGLTLETSAFRISVRWSIYIINSVDKTKFLYCKGTS